jgi:hypothetical protein
MMGSTQAGTARLINGLPDLDRRRQPKFKTSQGDDNKVQYLQQNGYECVYDVWAIKRPLDLRSFWMPWSAF